MDLPPRAAVKEAFQKAPEYVKAFIKSDEMTQAFTALRNESKLHLDDAGTFADIINAILLELVPLGQFESALAEHLPSVDAATRDKLSHDSNEKIFMVLRAHAAPDAVPAAKPAFVPAPMTTVSPKESPTPSIVSQKLAAPAIESPKEVTVPMPPAETKAQQPAANPRYSSGSDPYREPIE